MFLFYFYSKNEKYNFNADEVRIPYNDINKFKKDSEGRLYKYWSKKIGNYYPPQKNINGKYHLLGKFCYDVFDKIPSMATAHGKEYIGYPTQKPLALLERIIRASSNEGDMVLDPFCGCATTCVAAEKLKRKWTGIDVKESAFELVKKRLKKEVQGEEKDGQRNLIDYEKVVFFKVDIPNRTDRNGDDGVVKKYLYIISHPKHKGFYKVGIASNYKARLNSYQTGDPKRQYKLEYEYLTPYFREIEKYIHERFDNMLEWVRADKKDIIAEIKKKEKEFI